MPKGREERRDRHESRLVAPAASSSRDASKHRTDHIREMSSSPDYYTLLLKIYEVHRLTNIVNIDCILDKYVGADA